MHAEDVLALVLGVVALVLLAVALGAALMWRVVHQPKSPPALPVWVWLLAVSGGAMSIAAGVVVGQLSVVASGSLMSIALVLQLVQSLRHRPSRGP